MNYWDEKVIVPIKKHFNKEIELRLEAREIEQLLKNCHDAVTKEYILKKLDSIYRGYCLGEYDDYWLHDIMQRLMLFDKEVGKVIISFNLIETAASWANHSESVRVKDFIDILIIYDLSKGPKDWDAMEQQVNMELEKLKVYGDSRKGGYLALLHGYIRIRRYSDGNRKEQSNNLELLRNHWDFLKLVYSVMLHRIIDSGHRDFAAVANNIRIQKSHHQFVHIFYSAAKERVHELDSTEEGQGKINRHLDKILKIQKDTPQDNDTLDGLCSILFDDLQHFLEKNKMPSYDEVVSELQEMKSKVDSLNNQVEQMAQKMAAAVNASIPVEDIEKELMRLLPGAAYDVFTQVNSLLTGNKAWMERAADIKERILEKRDNPTIVKGNYYASGAHHDDKSRHIEIDKEDDLPKLPEK